GALASEDQDLLRNPGAGALWEWLTQRFPDAHLTPDSNLRMDLDIDSMEWLNLTLEIGRRAGVELEEDAIGRVEAVRDLLQEVANASAGAGGTGKSEGPREPGVRLDEALADPERFIDPEQRRWLRRLRPRQAALSYALLGLNRALMRACFRVSAEGL